MLKFHENYRLLNLYCISYAQVPKGLPYFAVEFGLDGGFAHVIENEDLIPHYFGKVFQCIILLIWSSHCWSSMSDDMKSIWVLWVPCSKLPNQN